MNFLSLFVLIPLLMLGGLYLAKSIKAIRGVMVAGSTALLILSVVLTFLYLGGAPEQGECPSYPELSARWKLVLL